MSQESTQAERLGPYRIVRKLGEGGMGVVHLAVDPQGRQVALKVLRSEVAGDATARRRLAREVATMRRARSPYIAEIVDADVTGQRPYVVTEYVPGLPLDEAIKQNGPLEGVALQRFAAGLATALGVIHAAGVIHRDLKPGNVMMVDGNPVVIDFGIAHAVDSTRITQTGMFIGTPGYLAPEIIEGEEPSAASDVHAWAATVLFACTGKPPFGSGSLEIVFYNITQGRANIDAVPDPIRSVVATGFARTPGERPTASYVGEQIARLDLGAGPLDMSALGDHLEDDRELATRRVKNANEAIATRRLGDDWTPPPPSGPGGVATPAPMPRPGTPAPRPGPPSGPPQTHRPPIPPHGRPGMPGQRMPAAPPRPGVPYGGQGYPPRQPYQHQPAKPAKLATTTELHLVSAMLLLVMAGCAVVLPFWVVILCLPLAAVLRAADHVSRQGRASGTGPFDDIARAVRDPAALGRSLGITLALVPYGFILGLAVTLLAALLFSGMWPENAAGWGMAILLLTVCAGPGVEGPRRAVAKVLRGTLEMQTPARITVAVVGVLAFLVVVFAFTNESVWAPIDIHPISDGLTDLRRSVTEGP